jgi:ABC-type dipeptide/oligopeptide/nickel transport system permease subunit
VAVEDGASLQVVSGSGGMISMDGAVTSGSVGAQLARSRLVRRLRTSVPALIGVTVLCIYLVLAIIGPFLAPYPPEEYHVQDAMQPPSSTYLFGTDEYGRDVFSRVLAGARSIVIIAFSSTLLGVLLGTLLGLVCGYYQGKTDELLMRLVDAAMSFPSLLLALLILTVAGSSMLNIIVCIAVLFIAPVARVVRSVALELRSQQYIQAAQARGERGHFIIFRELLPNAVAPITVECSIRVSYAVLIGASLGFLGLGVQPPTPDWGLMIYEGRNLIQIAPWVVLAPAVAISTLVIGTNLFADALSQVLDRSERGAEWH